MLISFNRIVILVQQLTKKIISIINRLTAINKVKLAMKIRYHTIKQLIPGKYPQNIYWETCQLLRCHTKNTYTLLNLT